MKHQEIATNDCKKTTGANKKRICAVVIAVSATFLASVAIYRILPTTSSTQIVVLQQPEITLQQKNNGKLQEIVSMQDKVSQNENIVVANLSQELTPDELLALIPEETAAPEDNLPWPSETYSWSDYKSPNKTWPANPDMGCGENYPNIDKKANSEEVYTQGIAGEKAPVTFEFPVKTPETTSYFGWRKTFGRIHYGIDFRGTTKTPIYAAARGTVTKWTSEHTGDFGKAVEIHHGDEVSTIYAHLSKLLVKPGDHVNQGDLIGYMGKTGAVTGVHLHFEIRKSAIPYNPFLGYLNHDQVK